MKTAKSRVLSLLFSLLTALNLPAALLAAMVLYANLAGELSGTFAWFKFFEDAFGLGMENAPLVFGFLGIVVAIYILTYILSLLPEFDRRPYLRLFLLHTHIGVILAFLASASSTSGPVGIAIGILTIIAYAFLACLVEFVFGGFLVKITQVLVHLQKPGAASRMLALAIRFRPTHSDLRRTLGLTRFAAKNLRGAADVLARLEGEGTKDMEVLEALETCYTESHEWEKCLHIQNKILDLNPNDMDARMECVATLERLDRTAEAIALLKAGLSKDNLSSQQPFLNLLLKAGKIDEAIETAENIARQDETQSIEAYRAILLIAPDNAKVKEKLATSLIAHGQKHEGIQMLEAIVEAAPERFELHTQLVQHYQAAERLDKAGPHLEALIDAGRDTAEISLLYGDYLFRQKKQDQALQHFQHAIETYAGDYRFPLFLAQLHLSSEALDNAQHCVKLALSNADNEEGKTRARLLLKRVDNALADRDIKNQRERLRHDPDNLDAHLDLIESLARRGQIDQLMTECETILENNSDGRASVIAKLEEISARNEEHFRILDYLADLKINGQEWDEAFAIAQRMADRSLEGDAVLLEQCRRLLRLNPDHLLSLRCMANLLWKKQDWEEAYTTHKKLIATDPDQKTLYYAPIFEAAVQTDRKKKAIEIGKAMIEAEMANVDILLQMTRFSSDLERFDDALDFLDQAEKIAQTGNIEILTLRKEVSTLRREKRLCEIEIRLERKADDFALLLEAGDLYVEAEEHKKAISFYQRASRDATLKDLAETKQALAMARLRMFDLAEEILDEVSLSIADPDTQKKAKEHVYETARIFDHEAETERALKLYKKIFRVDAAFRDVVDRVES